MGLLNRFTGLFRHHRLERDLDEELQLHIDLKTQENIAAGMPPEEARYAALRAFGGVEQKKEECRDADRLRWLEDVIQDLRYGLRQLRRNPGFTAVAVLTLALGIGANTAIFSVVDAVLLEPLPYQDPGQLVYISEFWPRERPADRVPTPDFVNWQANNKVFRGLTSWGGGPVNLLGSGNPEVIQAAQVSEEFFSTLGVQPLLGRTFLPKEERPDGERVVILTHALWRQQFGSDRDIIGKSITIHGQPYTVIGVMPAGFRFPGDGPEPQVFRPNIAATVANWHSPEYFRIQDVVGRLAPGVSLDAAKAQLTALTARRHGQEPPQFIRMREGMEIRAGRRIDFQDARDSAEPGIAGGVDDARRDPADLARAEEVPFALDHDLQRAFQHHVHVFGMRVVMDLAGTGILVQQVDVDIDLRGAGLAADQLDAGAAVEIQLPRRGVVDPDLEEFRAIHGVVSVKGVPLYRRAAD